MHHRLREIATAHFQARCLHEACERGLFTELSRSPASAAELASRLSLHPQACRMLCDALAALELLEEREGLYSNAPLARDYLIEGTPSDQGEMIAMYRRSLERWDKLAEALHCGHTPPPPASELDPRFVHAMHCTASVHAPLVDIERAGAARLLDLGGGAGTWGIHFASKWPDLRVTLVDLEPVVPIAREYAEIAGVADRWEGRAADFLSGDLGGDYDLVVVSNVLQCHSAADCRTLLKRAFACLRPGGRVLIHEFVRDGSLWPALFALHMLLTTSGGDTHTLAELRLWLREAGFGEPRVWPLEGTPATMLLAGRA